MPPVTYRTIEVDGLNIFYREAGRVNVPTGRCCEPADDRGPAG